MKADYILGISAFGCDSAAVVIGKEGIIAAAEEERFTRKKADAGFPQKAIKFCLNQDSLRNKKLSQVAFYRKPQTAAQKRKIERWVKKAVGKKVKISYVDHQLSHAASAFYPSPFNEAAVLVIDGKEEQAGTSFGDGEGNDLAVSLKEEPQRSIGNLYANFVRYAGFKAGSDDYKFMGLAAYGKPRFKKLILENLEFFLACNDKVFFRILGRKKRALGAQIREFDCDLAASAQAAAEELVLGLCAQLFRRTKKNNLCLAGEVALNCLANTRVLREGPFKRIWIQPASRDAGGALGAAFFVWYGLEKNKRQVSPGRDSQRGSLLGPQYPDARIRNVLKSKNIIFQELKEKELIQKTAALLVKGKVIAWFQGRMEFGPRSLGNRSILTDPQDAHLKPKLNRIKGRELFRPFAPTVLKKFAAHWFDLKQDSPYMLLVAKAKKSGIPAVVHVDKTSRIQTLARKTNPLFFDLISEFYRLSGCPVILNTSFNLANEPIVCSPEDALKTFKRPGIDNLVMGHFLIKK